MGLSVKYLYIEKIILSVLIQHKPHEYNQLLPLEYIAVNS